MDFLKVEFFYDPGDCGNMLEPTALVFPLIQFLTDQFALFWWENNFPVFGHKIREMFKQETFLVEDILPLDEFYGFIYLCGEDFVVVFTFDWQVDEVEFYQTGKSSQHLLG